MASLVHSCLSSVISVLYCVKALTLTSCVDTGVDLSFIVKAVPAVASDEKPEEQTHEIIQVSVVP